MPFRPFSFRKKTRRTRPAILGDQSSTPRGAIIPASAEMADARDDGAMSAIQMSLTALFEGTSLATKLPYISSVAGILLQVLTMREALKQYKEECEILVRKLARVAGIVVSVGELCKRHNLNEEDLPVGLRAILYSHLRELNGIENVVTQCTKIKGIKGLLLRNNLLKKIEQCDGELSNALQSFQAELSLDIRFALITEKREVASPSGGTEAIPTTPEGPDAPQIFFRIKSGLDVPRSESLTRTTSRLSAESVPCPDDLRLLWTSLTQLDELLKSSSHGSLLLYSPIPFFFFFRRALLCHWH
ncbi:hypothetical protein BJY52DRAFT_280879 [Lactarius psammicola]|nr:hypothetical protein BJY52DRAFT_280879 [Lactarius psammicola]